MDKICPTCGQRMLEHENLGVKLTRMQRLIVSMVQQAGPNGISTGRIFNALYGDDPDGGPLLGEKRIHVHIYHLNHRLAPVGKCIRAGKGRGPNYYTLIDIPQKKKHA